MSEISDIDQGAKRRLDFICGLALAVLSLIALVWMIPAGVPGEASRGEVAPSFFPNLTAAVILACSLAMIYLNRGTLRDSVRIGGWIMLAEIAGWGVLSIAIMQLLKHAGTVPASILATVVATVVCRFRGRWWIPAVVAVTLPFVLRYGVQFLFSIELP
jgi:cell division protein FtsW (lipid II flippase)